VFAAPGWLDELSLGVDGPPWLAMGLSRCQPADWLLVDEHRSEDLAERRRLLADRHDEVFAAQPGTEAAGEEVLDLIRTWLARHPSDLASDGGGEDLAAAADVHPLEVAGRLVQEDLCLMARHGPVHHLDAACLCFPSHWRLAEKIGRSAAALHGPVPRYDEELAVRVDRYLDRLRPHTIAQRRNWSVHDAPDLFAPWPPETVRALDIDDVAAGLWLRSERQTLRRLPLSGAVLFTIRVQQAPFGVLAGRPDVAARFAVRLENQPLELTAMNGLTAYRSPVLSWLRRISGERSPALADRPRSDPPNR